MDPLRAATVSEPFPIDDAASISVMRQQVRSLGEGLPDELIERAALVVSELGHNQLRYARLGEMSLTRVGDDGLDIVAMDSGPGLGDPAMAFSGGGPTLGGLGVGLAGVRRAANGLDVISRADEGLWITARVRSKGLRGGREFVLLGRPHPDEHKSGDDAGVVRVGSGAVAVVADGLGHGPLARIAARAAVRTVLSDPKADPVTLLERCDRELRGTRGAAVGIARVDRDEITVAIGGNIRGLLVGPDQSDRLLSVPRILGSRVVGRRFREMRRPFVGATLLLASDGVSERGLPRSHPAQGWPLSLAAHLMHRHGRANDDVTVLALR